jgi:hypothetical protein
MIPEHVAQDMIRRVLNGVINRFGSAEDTADEKSEDTRFIPSVLDSSVRYSHGGGNIEGDREIARINEEAQRIEEQQRKK